MDTRETLDLMKNLQKLHESRVLTEQEVNELSEEELTQEKEKFRTAVGFIPDGDFGKFVKNENLIMWGGVLNGSIIWSFYITRSKDESDCSIELNDGLKLNDNNLEIFNNLKLYYDEFYEFWLKEL